MAEYLVNTLEDESDGEYGPGDLSLREAVALANADPGADTIRFAEALAGGTLRLALGEIAITGELTLSGDTDGDGAPDITITADAAGDDLLTPEGLTDMEASLGAFRLGDNTRIFRVDAEVRLESLVLTGGSTETSGGAIAAFFGSRLEIRDSRIEGNRADLDGGGVLAVGERTDIADSTLSGNITGLSGGGLATGEGTSLFLSRATIADNTAFAAGGGLATGPGSMTRLAASTLSGNVASTGGGGVRVGEGASIELTGSTVEDNAAPRLDGGGISLAAGAAADIADSRIAGNTADGDGAGLEAGPDTTVTIADTVFEDNRGTGEDASGGAIHASGATLAISDSTLTGNRVEEDGAAIYLDGPGDVLTMERVEITSNAAASDGGGIILLDGAEAEIVDSRIASNSAENAAGGLFVIGSTLTLRGSEISGNAARVFGGIANATEGTLRIVDSTVSENVARELGGGIVSVSEAWLTDVTVSGNAAGGNGGGIASSGLLTLLNATLEGNVADKGAAIFHSGEVPARLIQSTVTGNLAASEGGGLSGAMTLANSIVAGNTVPGGADDVRARSGDELLTLLGVNLLGSAPAGFDPGEVDLSRAVVLGEGNAFTLADVFAALDPGTGGGLLADNLGPVATAALSPAPGNPALDAADDGVDPGLDETDFGVDLNGDGDARDRLGSLAELATDARGLPRDVDLPGAGGTPDLGAVELGVEAPSLVVTTLADVVDPADGETSLREAVGFVNTGVFEPGSEVTFADGLSGTIFLGSNGALAIRASMSVSGPAGAGPIALSADSAPGADDATTRVVEIDDGLAATAPEVSLFALTLRDGRADSGGGGGLLAEGGARLVLDTLAIEDNHAEGPGGGLHAGPGAVVMLADTTLDGNSSADRGGGAHFGTQSTVSVIFSRLTGNSAALDGGGAAFAGDSTVFLNSTTAALNSAGGDGGAVHVADGGSVSISLSLLGDNAAEGRGGGLGTGAEVSLLVSGGEVSGNGSGLGGGGIFLDRESTAILDEAFIHSNAVTGALQDGGGIHGPEDGSMVVLDSPILQNEARNGAGILLPPGAGLRISDSRIAENAASGSGGGLFVETGGSVAAARTLLAGNSAGAEGGGLYTRGLAALADSDITANTARFGGGILTAAEGGVLRLSDSTIAANDAAEDGGGIASRGESWLSGVTLSANAAGGLGGGIRATGPLTAVNTTLAGNTAREGGGLHGPATLIQGTVTGNAAETGAGLFADGLLTLANSLVAGNAAPTGPADIAGTATAALATEGVNLLGSAPAGVPADISGDILLGSGNMLTPADIFAALDPATGGGRLADNGGPVETVALATAENPALDGARADLPLALDETDFAADLDGDGDTDGLLPSLAALAADARGLPRDVDLLPGGTLRDIGAVETGPDFPGLSIAPLGAAAPEGTGLPGLLTFRVTRAGETAPAVTVDYAVSGRGPTPADAADFAGGALPSGTVSFAAGETVQVLEIETAPDALREPDEWLSVTLSDPSPGAGILLAEATGTILNDDPGPVDPPEGVIRGTPRADALTAGAGVNMLPGGGGDTLVIGRAANAGETTFYDARPGDTVQLAAGLTVLASVVTPAAVALDLGAGGRVQALNPGDAMFEPGGNVTTAAAGPLLGYADFAAGVLGAPLPDQGLATGGRVVIPEATGTDPTPPQAGTPAPPQGVIRGTGRDDTLLTGAGTILLPGDGADRVVISQAATPLETSEIEGGAGDVIQLAGGLGIERVVLTPTALGLTLDTGAEIRILEAHVIGFEPGGNATTGDAGPRLDYNAFAETVLGVPVPQGGAVFGGPVTIPDPVDPAPELVSNPWPLPPGGESDLFG